MLGRELKLMGNYLSVFDTGQDLLSEKALHSSHVFLLLNFLWACFPSYLKLDFSLNPSILAPHTLLLLQITLLHAFSTPNASRKTCCYAALVTAQTYTAITSHHYMLTFCPVHYHAMNPQYSRRYHFVL